MPKEDADKYEGRLQGVGDGYVLGWVWKPARPTERVSVSVLIDGHEAGSGVADHPREDLAQLGIGDGAHGFLVPLPDDLSGPGRLEVVAVAGLERAFVPASPSFWQEAPPDSRWLETSFAPGSTTPPEVARLPECRTGDIVFGSGGWRFRGRPDQPAPSQGSVVMALARLRTIGEPLRALGIPLVVGCLPSKLSVVREHYAGERAAGTDWLTRITVAQHDHDAVELLSLLPALEAARRHGEPYDVSGLDLNGRGGFFAARALLKEVAKRCAAITPPPLSDLHLQNDAHGELVLDWMHRRALRMPIEEHLANDLGIHVRVYNREDLPLEARLALVADTDGLALVPWLAERANRTTYFCTRTPPMEQLELEMPGAVILLLAEDDLHELALEGAKLSG